MITCPNCKFKFSKEVRTWPFHCQCGAIIYADGRTKISARGYGVPQFVLSSEEKEIDPPPDLSKDIVKWLASGQKLKNSSQDSTSDPTKDAPAQN